MKYEVRPVPDGRGTVELFVEGEQYNVAREYGLPNPPNTAWLTNPPAPFLPGGSSMMAEQYAKAAMERQRQNTGQLPLAQQMALASTLTQNLNNPAPAVGALAQKVATPSHQYYPNISSSYPVPMDSFISTGHALPPGINYNTPDHMWVATSGQMTPGTFISEVSEARRYQQRLAQAAFMWQEFRRSVVLREAQVERDVAALNATNVVIQETNRRVSSALQTLTGQEFGADRESWAKWWTDAKGYAYQPPSQAKPTFVQAAPLAYVPQYGVAHGACFARGTQVQTLEGLKAIETIQVGDRVLTQNVTTGSLGLRTGPGACA